MTSPKHQSFMQRFYTAELAQSYAGLRTPYGWTIDDVIRSGIENVDSNIGLYAGGERCYELFSVLFDKVTESYHEHKLTTIQPHNWLLAKPLAQSDPNGRYIRSTRIRIARNFANLPFPTAVSLEQRLAQEMAVQAVLEQELDGRYYPVNQTPPDIAQLLIEKRSSLTLGDRFMDSAGLNRHWPEGRGVFVDASHELFIWFGEEDFLRIMVLRFDSNLTAVFNRLTQAVTLLERTFDFAKEPRYGYLTSCPSNVGTTMRAGVNIHLPHLSKQPERLKALCERLRLQLRGTYGEHTAVENAIYDVSNKPRLGLSETDLVTLLNDGVQELIAAEQSLATD